ncbi:unnamed protein product, partial [Ixodes pacificus]
MFIMTPGMFTSHVLAFLSVDTLQNLCTCVWLVPYEASHTNVVPSNTFHRDTEECRSTLVLKHTYLKSCIRSPCTAVDHTFRKPPTLMTP